MSYYYPYYSRYSLPYTATWQPSRPNQPSVAHESKLSLPHHAWQPKRL